MPEDSLTELAKLFRERENSVPKSMTTGIVLTGPPNPSIRLNEVIILYPHQMVFAAHLLSGYSREVQINNGSTATLVMNDTLKADDEVIIMPVADGQLYYVLDKAVRF